MNHRVPPMPPAAAASNSSPTSLPQRTKPWHLLLLTYRLWLRRLRFGRTAIASRGDRSIIISTRIDSRERATTILLSIASAGTMMLTYFGVSIPMSELGGGILQKGQALAFAVTIGVFSWLGWFYLFGVVYWLKAARLSAAMLAGVLYVLVIAAIDAPFNMLALAGGSAVQMSLVDTAAHYEAKPGPTFERITAIRRLLPAIRAQAARFKKLEEQELATGAYSGKPKAGKVSAGFGQIATLLGTLAEALESNLGQAEAIQREITGTIAKMKAQAYVQAPIRARIEAVSIAADRADELLAQMSQFDATLSIRATLKALENIFPTPTQAGNAFERTQNAELGAIAQMAKPVAETLQEALLALTLSATDNAERIRPADPMTAIKTYWRPLLPQWIAALFIDLAPGILLVILIAARREAEHAAKNHNREGGAL